MTRPAVSFEFFPPKNIEGSFRLWDTVQALAPMGPEFVSVTYGAGGTTRQLTHEAVDAIHKKAGLRVAAHLTCVEATRAETLDIVNGYAKAGVEEIVALRGDPPKGSGGFTAHPQGFSGSVELIETLAAMEKFRIRVGAIPSAIPMPHTSLRMSSISSASSTRAPTAPSPSSSSRRTPFFGFATPARRRASRARSFPASCRSRIGRARASSPRCAAPRSRKSWPTASNMPPIKPRPTCWPRRSPPSCATS